MKLRHRVAAWGILLASALLLAGCGGGGGDSDDGATAQRDIAGTWTFPCEEKDGVWRSETLRFDESTGTVTHAGVQFSTPDCSDFGNAVVQQAGNYVLGKTVGCASGDGFECTELDIAWDGGVTRYGMYSVYESSDPDILCLSDLERDPAQRPADVDPSTELHRMLFPDKDGHAILDVYLVDGGISSIPPPPRSGYARLSYDLNEGTGGNYIWLYYRLGRANGADGVPLGEIYTVDEVDGEKPYGGTKDPVNLNANSVRVDQMELWLYKRPATDTIMRCVAVANATDGVKVFGPPAPGEDPNVVWVEEIKPDNLKCSQPEYPADVQDLNEGEGFWTDYIYLGYCAD